MRFLAIDYGAKRIGVAFADERGMAFPECVVPNAKDAVPKIAAICAERGIEKIVLGESYDETGAPNPVMKDILRFKHALARATDLPVVLEDETATTVEAAQIQGRRKNIDASAAALILQRYLDARSGVYLKRDRVSSHAGGRPRPFRRVRPIRRTHS